MEEKLKTFLKKLLKRLQFAFADGSHHIAWRAFGQQFPFHVIHVGSHMAEELMIALAEIVQARLSVGCNGKPVLGTFSVAGKEEFTFLALFRKGALLVLSEGLLAFAIHHFYQCLFVDVSELEFRKHEMVAGIDIPVELNDSGMSAGLGQRAYSGLFAHPIG